MATSEAARRRAEAEAYYGHPLQYAHCQDVYVGHTENMTDDDVRREALKQFPSRYTIAHLSGAIHRFNRCPACEQWSPCDVRAKGAPDGDA